MSSEDNKFGRRTVIAGIGSAAAVGALGMGMSGGAAATSEMEFDFTDDVEIVSDDGSLAWVAFGLQGVVTWENYDEDVEKFDWTDEISVEVGGEEIESAIIYDVSDRDFGPFGRDQDTADSSGEDGHITFHIGNPDGQGVSYEGGEEGEDGADIGDSWTVVQDEEFRNASEASELSYSVPDGVNPGYSLPQEVIDAEALEEEFPDEGETTEFEFTFNKTVTLIDDSDNEILEEEGTGTFTVEVENEEGEFSTITGQGVVDAGSGS